jgi:hypothetical protein
MLQRLLVRSVALAAGVASLLARFVVRAVEIGAAAKDKIADAEVKRAVMVLQEYGRRRDPVCVDAYRGFKLMSDEQYGVQDIQSSPRPPHIFTITPHACRPLRAELE